MGEKIRTAEIKCVKCGKDEFKLTRMVEDQILAECIHCGEAHTMDAIDKDGNTGMGASIQFWSPKMTEE